MWIHLHSYMAKDSNEVMLIYMILYEFRLNSYMAQDSNLSLCIIIMFCGFNWTAIREKIQIRLYVILSYYVSWFE